MHNFASFSYPSQCTKASFLPFECHSTFSVSWVRWFSSPLMHYLQARVVILIQLNRSPNDSLLFMFPKNIERGLDCACSFWQCLSLLLSLTASPHAPHIHHLHSFVELIRIAANSTQTEELEESSSSSSYFGHSEASSCSLFVIYLNSSAKQIFN